MSILVDETTKLIVQGVTGRQGRFHTKLMLDYGTEVVAGVTPGKEGQEVEGVPVYDMIKEALGEKDANTSIIFVPAPFAADSVFESIDSGIETIVLITEGIPVHDMIKVRKYTKESDVVLIGSNTPGVITPGAAKVGIMPANVFTKGKIGVVSRSGTLTYEIVSALTESDLGQSTCVGIGGDPIKGMDFVDILELFEEDQQTEGIVIVGEIGGLDEEDAAQWIEENATKPIAAFVAGETAPHGKRMGHAGAIIERGRGIVKSKIEAFEKAGVLVAETPSLITKKIMDVL